MEKQDEKPTFTYDFAALVNLHEIQMPVMWQIECFVPIYNAVHDARIVNNLGKFILKLFTCMYVTWYTCTFGSIGTLN